MDPIEKEDKTGTPENENVANFSPPSTGKLDVYNWLGDLPLASDSFDIVEIRFKNTRKGFFKNVNALRISPGDIVAVEASPGHDIGIVTLVGELVKEQLKKYKISLNSEFKKVYRVAKPTDIEKWKEAMGMEKETMLESRSIAGNLKLNMKIGDVEYQGDRTKAIFYYIADERVDFRELIKVLADRFKIRVEMRQIGARQEAGRIGGIGSCGRQLCCSSWISNFVSVTTGSARIQELSLNPQKLAGQCGKLKCCLNYELASYYDARKDFPVVNEPIQTKKGRAFLVKTDIFRRIMWFSYHQDQENTSTLIPIPVEKVASILDLNKKGAEIEDLENLKIVEKKVSHVDYTIDPASESLTRFDSPNKGKKHKNRNKQHNFKPPQTNTDAPGKPIPKKN